MYVHLNKGKFQYSTEQQSEQRWNNTGNVTFELGTRNQIVTSINLKFIHICGNASVCFIYVRTYTVYLNETCFKLVYITEFVHYTATTSERKSFTREYMQKTTR